MPMPRPAALRKPLVVLVAAAACKDGVVDSPEDSPVDSDPPVEVSWGALPTLPSWTSVDEGYATGLAWADVDGDEDGDLVIAYGNDMSPGPLAVYLNHDGELEVEASWTSAAAAYHGHLAVADLDGDGWVDVAVTRFLGEGRFEEPGGVDVYLNQSGELARWPAWSSPDRFYSFSCALGDVDRDGDADLAVAVGEFYRNAPDRSRVYLNDGRGGFGDGPVWTTEVDRHSLDAAWVDVDRDGWLDLAFANVDTGHTLYRNLGGELEAEPSWTAEGPGERFEGNTLDWGDVDGDGWLDLAISDNNQVGGAGTVSLYCGPDLERCWESADPPLNQSAVSLEDVDGDGRVDLAAGAWWGRVRLYRNLDGALEAEPSWQSNTSLVVEAFGWEDVDGAAFAAQELTGEGLVEVPGRARVLSVSGGVATDGWLSGPGPLTATVLAPAPRDLAVSNWERLNGNQLYAR